ncbi:peroxiredoxin-2F, mitochondrial isoform X2 [Cynara cardunculus var. scolymus]|uniref:peroxiredoxin-2F, mitochondrial isoform X2 n=1 Tax=Cynara cardunculus var. scolymus TaxID=59895 RepID=UPI000D625680|nr:peroxiredoxin-2F, mitochondrial isoform X2 [Cynara cardunculus var. scolymus]
MAYAVLRRSSMMKSMATGIGESWRRFASVAVGTDLVAAAPNVSLQKARSWDEGVSSQFSTTTLSDIFVGAFTGVCSAQHVPSYKKNIDKFKAKGIDSVICVSVNDPYTMNGWAEKLEAKEVIEFYGDFDGKFHKSLELELDLSSALLGHRSTRWSAFVEDGKIKVLNVENVPSDFKVSGGEVILGQI